VTGAQFRRWTRLHEVRARAGLVRSPWFAAIVVGAVLVAFVTWRAGAGGPVAGVRAWLAGSIVAFAIAFMRVPFHIYWRADAALLAQLPISGGALFDAALARCMRAAAATALAVLLGVVPLLGASGAAGGADLFVRCLAFGGVLALLAAALMPAAATYAATLVVAGREGPAGSLPAAPSTLLGAIPGFVSTVVIVLLILAAPWLYGRPTSLPAGAVLGGLAAASVAAIVAIRTTASRVMGTILRDVSALDRQQLATLDIHPPTAIERAIAGRLGDGALPYRKDARLMRRRYPMAFALGALAFLVLVIVAGARPADPAPWLVAIVAGAAVYAAALAGRLARPPIELPRLSATLPIRPEAIRRAKVAWVAGWATIFVALPLVVALVRTA
jgi:hypothetical protein